MKTNLIVLCLIVCGGLARAQVQIDNIPDVPAVLYVTNYDQSSEYDVNGYWGTIFQYTNVWLSWGNDTHDKYTFDWTDGQGGTMVFNDNYTQWQGDTSGYGSAGYTNVWPATEWPVLTNGCEQYSYTAQEGDDPPESDSWTWTTGYPPIAYESCESRVRVNWADFTDIWPDGSGVAYGGNSTYHRHAQTEMRLRTGGRPGGSNRQNLFCLSATAEQWRLVTEQDLNAVYELKEVIDVGPVPATDIKILGMALDSYGNLWVVLPDDQDIPVTPVATGVDYYAFIEPPPPKYTLFHQTEAQALTNPDPERQDLGVGEEVDLGGMPGNILWSTTTGGLSATNGSGVTFTAPSNTASATVTGSIGGAQVQVDFDVVEPDGYDPAHTYIQSTNKLGQNVIGAEMSLHVVIAPTDVSFYRVTFMEVGEDAVDLSGYWLTNTPPSHTGNGADNPFGVGDDNSSPDYCKASGSGVTPLGQFGNYRWPIPVIWYIGIGGATGAWMGWNQDFSCDSNGTVSITKFGHTVTRTINDNISTQ